MAEQAKWYVVHTYSGYENKVATDLEIAVANRNMTDLIQKVKVPVEQVPELKNGKERIVEHKLFPGYVIVKMIMTDDSWYIVRNCNGVTGFVGDATDPWPLSDAEVEKMGLESDETEVSKDLTLDYAVGDNVEITAGPLEGFAGLVEKIDMKNQKVFVKVSMFGRETPAELELNQAKPL